MRKKVMGLVLCAVVLLVSLCYANDDSEYYARMERIAKIRDEDMARMQELKRLELQTLIYAQRIELQRDSVYVKNDANQSNSNSSVSRTDMDIKQDIGVDSYIKNKK